MTKSGLISALLCLSGVSGCWKSARSDGGDDDTGGDAGADGDADGDVDGDSDADLDGGTFHEPDAYVDPGCETDPDEPWEGQVDWACDPYTDEGCDLTNGEACYAYIVYPTDPCSEEEFGSACAIEGWAGQGEHCSGTTDCQSGYSCFVTGEGTQCLSLCAILGGEPQCPAGLVCGWTDIPEVGACQ
jgi:hypothetical protein